MYYYKVGNSDYYLVFEEPLTEVSEVEYKSILSAEETECFKLSSERVDKDFLEDLHNEQVEQF